MVPVIDVDEVRRWVEDECPPSQRQPVTDPRELFAGGSRATHSSADAERWFSRMHARGWVAPTWPVEFGGAGLAPADARVLEGTLRGLGCRPAMSSIHGLGMIGPAILEFGTDAQRHRFLPEIAAGRVRWCQGFSEPGAGSDLAGLTTRAVRAGDRYVVRGQKTWTSFATQADWIFVLARTDATVPKRDGLSLLLVDLASPGVTVRPITLIDGTAEFCEVFLDEVAVPVEQRLGAEGDGWRIARWILGRERQLLGSDTGFGAGVITVEDLAAAADLRDPAHRDLLATADIEREACRALLARPVLRPAGPHPSVVKLAMSSMMRHQADTYLRLAGPAAIGWAGDAFEASSLDLTRAFLYSRTWTIAGGSSEIQRNVLARQVLDLPHLGPEEP